MTESIEPTRRGNALSLVLSLAIAGVLLYFSLRGVDWKQVWHTLANARLELVVAFAFLTWLSLFLRSLRWRVLLNAEGHFSVATVFWANSAGYLGNNFLPARAGELVRTFLISSQSHLSKTYVLTLALSERLMDVIALVLGSSIVLMTVDKKPVWMNELSRTMAIVAGAGAILIMVLPHTGHWLERIIVKLPLPEGLRRQLSALTSQILLGLRAFHSWARLTGFVLLTIAVWGMDSIGCVVGARSLGITISFPVALLLLTGLGLGSALPSTPGYVGIYQFVAVSVLPPFGVDRDQALAYILMAQAMGYFVITVCGLPGIFQFRRRKTRSAIQ